MKIRLGNMRYYVNGAKVLYTLKYISKCTLLFQKNSCQRTVLINLHISRNGLKMATILGHLGCSFYGGSSKGKGSHRNPDYSTKLWPFGEFLPFSASREKLVGVQLKDVRNG